jgi:hypothetical protein
VAPLAIPPSDTPRRAAIKARLVCRNDIAIEKYSGLGAAWGKKRSK